MSAEERELIEEEQAIKAAQKTAKEIFGFPRETSVQVTKAQANPAAGSKGRGCSSRPSGPTEGPMARWLARAAVQDDAV